jgi:hypothetical protein
MTKLWHFSRKCATPGLRKGMLKVMIKTTEQLEQAIAQMGRMQRILESYRSDILSKNPRNFAVFAEGPLDEIRKLQAEVSEYVGGFDKPAAA